MPISSEVAIGARAMQESRAWPVVFKAGSAALLAEACLAAVEKSRGKPMAKQDAMLEGMEKEFAELAKSRRIQTEEGRALINAMVRLVEGLRYGEPKTPPISQGNHHA